MAAPPRVRPTLFDKLVSNTAFAGQRGEDAGGNGAQLEIGREGLRYAVASMDRFNEQALRATVRRELTWLLNTVQMGSGTDLERYPHVQTSVLNYGVAELSGKVLTERQVQQRAREIRDAIVAFEPRIEPRTLLVAPRQLDRENALGFDVQGDVISAVNALPVRFVTEVDVDTGDANVRD